MLLSKSEPRVTLLGSTLGTGTHVSAIERRYDYPSSDCVSETGRVFLASAEETIVFALQVVNNL